MIVLKSSIGQLPEQFHEAYLQLIASWLLEEHAATEDDLSRNSDNAYTRGSTRFGRQRQRIMNESLSGQHPWLKIVNGGQDLVFTIHDIPCRFSNDDPDAPKKRAVVEAHLFQMPLLAEAEPGEAARFVFVIDRGPSESADPQVVLLGISNSNEEVCRWTSSPSIRSVGEAVPSLPEAVQLPKPTVAPKGRSVGTDGVGSAGP